MITPSPAAIEAAAKFYEFLGQHGTAKTIREGKGFRTTAEVFGQFEYEITSPLLDRITELEHDNARLRAGFNKLCDDMAYATSGGMSWITHAEVEEFKRRAKEFGLEHTPTEEDV